MPQRRPESPAAPHALEHEKSELLLDETELGYGRWWFAHQEVGRNGYETRALLYDVVGDPPERGRIPLRTDLWATPATEPATILRELADALERRTDETAWDPDLNPDAR